MTAAIVGLAETFEDFRMLQQRNGSQRDHVGGGFVAGLHHDHCVDGHGVVVELAGRDIVGDEPADQVVAGIALFPRHQLLDVGIHLDEALRPLLVGGVHVQSGGGVVLEEFEVFGRDAQQQRDHHRRHREAEVAHDVGRRALVDHRVQVFVDQFLDLRPHGFGAPEGELAGHHAPQPMMLGIVDPRENYRCRVVVGRIEQVREGFAPTAAGRPARP